MKKILGDLANILTGVTLREKPISTLSGGNFVLLMQLSDLNAAGNVQTQTMMQVEQQPLFDKFTVKAGDIVFRGRGAGIVAAVMPQTGSPVAVASPLIIIRPNTKEVDPDYLVWAMTNDKARRYYTEHSRGSHVVGIGKGDLNRLEIDVPPLNVQKKIGQLKRLEYKEQHLLIRHQKAKSRLIEEMINNAIHKEKSV